MVVRAREKPNRKEKGNSLTKPRHKKKRNENWENVQMKMQTNTSTETDIWIQIQIPKTIDKKYQKWYTIDALGAILQFSSIGTIDTFDNLDLLVNSDTFYKNKDLK